MMAEKAARKVSNMRLRVLLPADVLVDEPVAKIVAEAEDGAFCLLPRHVDFVAALKPGILCYYTDDGAEHYAAVDEGVLVKCAGDVQVSVLDAVLGEDLAELETLVAERFLELDEHERKARTALGRLEAAALRGFRDLQERLRG